MLYLVSFIAVACAALPCLVFLWNFGAYERPRPRPRKESQSPDSNHERPTMSLLTV